MRLRSRNNCDESRYSKQRQRDRSKRGFTIVADGCPEKGLSETPLAESALVCRRFGDNYWRLNILHLAAETGPAFRGPQLSLDRYGNAWTIDSRCTRYRHASSRGCTLDTGSDGCTGWAGCWMARNPS